MISLAEELQPAPQLKKKSYCRFYGTKNGGMITFYLLPLHTGQAVVGGQTPDAIPTQQTTTTSTSAPPIPAQHIRPHVSVPPSSIVRRPVPAAQSNDPRSFQISQLKRRYSPKHDIRDDGTIFLTFALHPSDPDFPFELPKGLECVLKVPANYAKSNGEGGRPALQVNNAEMGEQWRRRVEMGFASLAEGMGPTGTLLGLMNRLDRELEGLLMDKQPEMITIVTNKPKMSKAAPDIAKESDVQQVPAGKPIQKPPMQHTNQQLEQATVRRNTQTRQLESRLGRLEGFESRSAGDGQGVVYTVPISPRKPLDLPVQLRAVSKIRLFVPLTYPLQPCTIELLGVSKDAARNVEVAFEKKVKDGEGTLMGHSNMLAQNIHLLAMEEVKEEQEERLKEEEVLDVMDLRIDDQASSGENPRSVEDDDRSHIKVIPRPPEWDAIPNDGDDGSSESGDSDFYDSGDESTEGEKTDNVPTSSNTDAHPVTAPERGISLSFPQIELYGIELLELTSLGLTLKCTRCKQTKDISNLHSHASHPHKTTCNKCAQPFSITYNRQLIHQNATRAGYLDLEGCTPHDLLPSAYLPTCSSCSTTHPPPGVTSVRGASTLAICRSCHSKMTFKFPEAKFMLISTNPSHTLQGAPTRKKPKENLGITLGQPLPDQGPAARKFLRVIGVMMKLAIMQTSMPIA
ncbi:MAG: hypothetical protein Q9164_005503 [Protoblastenia rupestris]